MKVSELIEILIQLPQDMEVLQELEAGHIRGDINEVVVDDDYIILSE